MDQTPQLPPETNEAQNSDDEQTPVLPALAESFFARLSVKMSPIAIQWLVGIAAFALIAFQLGTQSLFETSEGRYASVARAMADGGSWLKPELNGVHHYTKPPVTYWASAVGMKLFGITEKGAKAFLPFAAALTAVGCYRIGLLLTSLRGALCGAIVLLTSLFFAVQFRGLTADPLLAMFETWMVWALVRYHTRPSPALASGFWALAGAAFLTKGPPGLLPLLGLVPGLALRGGADTLKSLFSHLRGWALFGLIGLGWYLWIGQAVPGLLEYFLFDETVARVATEAHGRPGPVWYFIVVLFAGLFPWTAFFAGSLSEGWRDARDTGKTWGLPLFLWLAVPFIVLSVVKSKLAPYALPLLVPAALMTGSYLSRLFAADDDEPFAYKLESALTIMAFAILGVVVMTISILGFLPDPKIARIAYFIAFYFMFLAVFGYSFMNLGIVKGIMLVLGVTVPGVMLLLLPAVNGDEEIWKGTRLPGYRALLRDVAALPTTTRILFADDVLESGKFYTGRNIPTWDVKREKRFDPRAEMMIFEGEEILRTMAAPDLYLLMREKTRNRVRYITKYTIEEVRRQGTWGLYVCGRPLNDMEAAVIAAPVSAGPENASDAQRAFIAGSGTGAPAGTAGTALGSGSRPAPGAAHIDAILSPGKQIDPVAAEWAAAITKRASEPATKTAPAPTAKKTGSVQKPPAVASASAKPPASSRPVPPGKTSPGVASNAPAVSDAVVSATLTRTVDSLPATATATAPSPETPASSPVAAPHVTVPAPRQPPATASAPADTTASAPVKKADNPVTKPTPKPAAKPAAKPAPKPVAKPVTKAAPKTAPKPVAKLVAKPGTKPAAKPGSSDASRPAPAPAAAPTPTEPVSTPPAAQRYEPAPMNSSVRSNQPPKR
ncbi:MAG TPA: glycosyltransferase family 39 protein [Candidatus Ozemobacteraceae bacterium]|nr:glycosyltransferase family 39 protein [Candidatus Ozemobacteraceae bacterium]